MFYFSVTIQKMHAYLLLLFAGWAAAQSTGDLRLVRNGFTSSSYTSGRLEIYYRGQWGTVCNDLWDSTNTRVACRQLGFYGSSTRWTTSSSGRFGSTSRPIWLDNVNCIGTESRLSSCPSNLYGSHNCGHSLDVAIYCTTTTTTTSSPTPRTGDLRLVRNGLTSSSYTSGRLEIYYSGRWGTVCDDSWDSTNTRVACRQLGYSGYSTTSWTTSSAGGFGSTSRQIWLDNVNCYGTESRLSSCRRNSYGSHDCVHSEDVAIYCTSSTGYTSGTVSSIVGIIVGVSIGGFVLFVVIPIAICVIVGIAVAVSSSKRSRRPTTVTTTAPAPTTTATITSSGSQSYTAQGYPYPAPGTDSKLAPPPDYTAAQQMEMSAYPPPTQAAYPYPAYPPQ